jgi:hypothetical protein
MKKTVARITIPDLRIFIVESISEKNPAVYSSHQGQRFIDADVYIADTTGVDELRLKFSQKIRS